MSVLISYSHSDADFALRLTKQIFLRGGHVWIDQCELAPGDSIYESIQEAITKASAIIVILSQKSVESLWCRREIAAGMTREATERKILVIPLLLEDCQIPLFLQDKLYADFRTRFDVGIGTLMRAIAKFTVHNAGRVSTDSDDFHTDYSYDTIFRENKLTLFFHLFQHSSRMPISVHSEICMEFNKEVSIIWEKCHLAGLQSLGELKLVEWACEKASTEEWIIELTSPHVVEREWLISESDSPAKCLIKFKCRRLGDEIGMNTLVRGHYEFEKILNLMRTRIAPEEHGA